MVTKARAAGRSKERRQRIINVAVEMFSEQEYEDITIDDLCRRADVAKGLVFYYFTDKRGLFAAAAKQVWNELAEKAAPRSGEDTVTSRLHGYLRRYLEYVEANPKRYMVLMGNGHSSPGVQEIVLAARQCAMSGVTSSLGCPANPPPRLRQAVHGWAQLVDTVARDWAEHRDVSSEDMIDICVQTLVAAVRSANSLPLDHEKELEALTHVVDVPASRRQPQAGTKAKPQQKRSQRSAARSIATGTETRSRA